MSGARLLTTLTLVVLALAAAGCGGGDDNKSSASTDSTGSAGETDLSKKPKLSKGEGDPPSELVVQDVVVGKGEKAKSGDTVAVQYVGVLFDSGEEFDASWNGDRPGKPLQFPLGAGQVIPGWDQGVVGMKEGGRRKLIIPAQLAYGAQGFPPQIPPNSALIFDVDLKKIVG